MEIVKMTGLVGPTLTVERGQGGTSARAWEVGSLIACRVTAENANRWLQKGNNREGAYNPNYVLTGAYTGEKYYQTGPDAAQRRWWINVTGDKWRLLTGDIFGSEYYDSWGWVFAPLGWQLVSQQVSYGLVSSCVFNGKLYCGGLHYAHLYEWDGIDNLDLVASTITANQTLWGLVEFQSTIFGIVEGGILLQWNGTDTWFQSSPGSLVRKICVHLGELYGAGQDGKLYKWNGAYAWVQVAAKYQDAIMNLISFSGSLYGSTYYVFLGTGGRLFQFTGLNWGVVAGKYSNEVYGRCIVEHDGKIFVGTGSNEGALLEWNGVNAWVMRAQANPAGTGGDIYGLTTLDGEIYVYHSVGGIYELSKWDGVSGLVWQADDPTYPADYFQYQIIGWNGSIFGMGMNGYLWRYTP